MFEEFLYSKHRIQNKELVLPLSKSDYMNFLRHPAWLWLKKNDPSKIPPVDPETQQRMKAGYEFEEYAERLFPDAKKIGFNDFSEYRTMLSRTSAAWSGGARCVVQGSYQSGELTCITDILENDGDGYVLTEIKSSTSVKIEHEWDLAFQKLVLEAVGYKIHRCRVAHVNSSYVRDGNVDPRKLVTFTDVTEKVGKRLEKTIINIKTALAILKSDNIPDLAPENAGLNAFSDWLEIRKDLEPKLPNESVYHLPYLTISQAKGLKKSKISVVSEIVDVSVLSGATAKYWNAKSQSKRVFNKKKLQKFLTCLEYPIYYFDYETSQNVIPLWEGTRPYQQVPFQYSLHVKRNADSPVEHLDYLHITKENPIQDLLKSLRNHVGDVGSILVWYAPFETSRNKEMAEILPEYANFLFKFNERVIDLMNPFKEGTISDPAFQGSASIKKVLPVMVPGFSYNDLDIKEGGTAARIWKEATIFDKPDIDVEKTYKDLRAYCMRDTLAMVLIHEALHKQKT